MTSAKSCEQWHREIDSHREVVSFKETKINCIKYTPRADVQTRNIGSTRFDIGWQHDTTSELPPTIRYSAFYKPAQSSLPSVYKDTVGLEKTLTISGLTPSTSYQVEVKALW